MSSPGLAGAPDLNRGGFDQLAHAYDVSFTHTQVGRTLREMVWSRLELAFRESDRILEIGCGTGEDALHLACRGMSVVAIDASRQMIEVARGKADGHLFSERIEFRHVPMEDLGTAFQGERFDGLFSNFGAINCVRDLRSLIDSVADRLAPGAPLVWVVMGRYVPWEWAWFLLRGDWRRAFRRMRSDGVRWRGLTIDYPTPAHLQALLRPRFAIRRVIPLGFVLPPSYAAGWLERAPRSLRALARLERMAQRLGMLASCADHYIVEAHRLPDAVATPGRPA